MSKRGLNTIRSDEESRDLSPGGSGGTMEFGGVSVWRMAFVMMVVMVHFLVIHEILGCFNDPIRIIRWNLAVELPSEVSSAESSESARVLVSFPLAVARLPWFAAGELAFYMLVLVCHRVVRKRAPLSSLHRAVDVKQAIRMTLRAVAPCAACVALLLAPLMVGYGQTSYIRERLTRHYVEVSNLELSIEEAPHETMPVSYNNVLMLAVSNQTRALQWIERKCSFSLRDFLYRTLPLPLGLFVVIMAGLGPVAVVGEMLFARKL